MPFCGTMLGSVGCSRTTEHGRAGNLFHGWAMDATTVQPTNSYLAPRVATPFFGYGYQVWIFPGEPRRFALLGIRGQMILVDPTSKLVMVHTAVRQKPSDRAANAETIALWLAAVAQFGQ